MALLDFRIVKLKNYETSIRHVWLQPKIIFSNVKYNDSIGFLDCEVEELKTSTKQACIFPFEFNQISFNGCTTMFDEKHKPWCATKVNVKGKGRAAEGFWGYCQEICPIFSLSLSVCLSLALFISLSLSLSLCLFVFLSPLQLRNEDLLLTLSLTVCLSLSFSISPPLPLSRPSVTK